MDLKINTIKVKTERYWDAVERLPKQGKMIVGYQQQIFFYQDYNHHITDCKKRMLHNHELDRLFVTVETICHLADEDLAKRIGVD